MCSVWRTIAAHRELHQVGADAIADLVDVGRFGQHPRIVRIGEHRLTHRTGAVLVFPVYGHPSNV